MAKAALHTAFNLLFFALVGTIMLTVTFQLTKETIEKSEEEEKLRMISQIVPAKTYDNDIMKDTSLLNADPLLGSDELTTIYRGRLKGQPSITVLQAYAPDGYGGRISLIVAVKNNGEISGVRVVSHKETPGLGDYVEYAKNSWINVFNGASLENLKEKDWKVKKDGGKFDYMAGATITPRAVIKAVHKAMQYYDIHQNELYIKGETINSASQENDR